MRNYYPMNEVVSRATLQFLVKHTTMTNARKTNSGLIIRNLFQTMDYQQTIRVNARLNKQRITSFLEHHYLFRENGKARARSIQLLCIFCGDSVNITKEHILPRWVFDRDPKKFFNSVINGLAHKYNETTVPACAKCNNNLLSMLEKQVFYLFSTQFRKQEFFKDEEKADVIRWLEILDYKYQVFSLVTRFRALKGKGTIPFLSDYPLSVLDSNVDYSPTKVMKNLRESIKRIAIKSKNSQLNSLVTFTTKNPDMHFFHKNNDFLFIELPEYNLALLHFYKRTFIDELQAKDAAMDIIKLHY